MKNFSLDKLSNYLIFAMLMLVIFILGTVISTLALGDMVVGGDYPVIGLLLQLATIGWLLWFSGKRLYHQIIIPPAEVALPPFAAYFVGALRGLLIVAVPGIVAMALLLWLNPAWLFLPLPRQIGVSLLVIGILGGISFPPRAVARRTRLWLLTALVAQFFMVQGMTKLLQLRHIRFDYKVDGHYSTQSFPLLDSGTLQKCLPSTATKIHFYGYRGLLAKFIWECQVTPEEFQTFAAVNNYKFTRNGNFLIYRNDTMIIWYNEDASHLRGYFSNTKLEDEFKADPLVPVGDTKPAASSTPAPAATK